MIDFYRRQYYHEVQFGLRDYKNTNTKMEMPPFILLRQFGGALPAPNGFEWTDGTTISKKDMDRSRKRREESLYEDEYEDDYDSARTARPSGLGKVPKESINPNVPPHLKDPIMKPSNGMMKTQSSEYGLDDEDFWKWVEEEESENKEQLD